MSGEKKLLPCPFCGSENLTGPHLKEYVGDRYCPSWWLECDDCPCGMETNGDVVQLLINAWNRRAEDAK